MAILLRTPTEEEQGMLDFTTKFGHFFQDQVDYFSACFLEEADRHDPDDAYFRLMNAMIVDVLNEAYEVWDNYTKGGTVNV